MIFTDIVDICISVCVTKPIVHSKLRTTKYFCIATLNVVET